MKVNKEHIPNIVIRDRTLFCYSVVQAFTPPSLLKILVKLQ